MSKRKLDVTSDTSPSTTTSTDTNIFTSTPIHDRSSTFIAIFAPTTANPQTLQRHAPFADAMHRMLAWRKPSAQKSLVGSFTSSQTSGAAKVVYETGSDEDGEKYAGKKLEKVLTEMDVTGTVVVARWYGGVLLGPVRFKWIEDSAREAIQLWMRSVGRGTKTGEGSNGDRVEVKRVKVDEKADGGQGEEKEKERMAKVLVERDSSISVLRGMLAEKNARLNGKEEGDGADKGVGVGGMERRNELIKSPSVVTPGYTSMPLQRLKQLEKARDATLTWILKQIDVVEAKIQRPKESTNEI